MKKLILTLISAVMLLTFCFCLTACTMKTTDPAVAAEEKTELEAAQFRAENGVWHDVPLETGEKLLDLVKEVGELSFEALDVAFSGSSTIETVYDYAFRLSVKGGNFFIRKKGEFTYYVGERFTRTYSDGKVKETYEEEKLVVNRSMSKDVAKLSQAQLELVRQVFEPFNAEVMQNAFEKVAEEATKSGYAVSEIPAADFRTVINSNEVFDLDIEKYVVKGYEITTSGGTSYVFLSSSPDWAEGLDGFKQVARVGRVFCIATSDYVGAIKNVLTS